MPDADTYIGRRPMGEGALEIDPLWGVDMGDADVWARSLIKSKRRKKTVTIESADLENAISAIRITDTIEGSSTVVVSFEDPDWRLTDSGFFDANQDGKLDTIEVNYPDESKLWWRCTQIAINANRSGAKIDMTFMERACVLLLHKRGPKKARRGRTTRAEFIKGLVNDVKAVDLKFRSRQLHAKQNIAKPTELKSEKTAKDKKDDKDKGINREDDVTVKGVRINDTQIGLIEEGLAVADELNAPKKATEALVCAAIGESTITDTVNSLGYGGVWQGQVSVPGSSNWFANMSPKERAREEATSFLKGGRGYQAGGAIHLAKNSLFDPGAIATKVEASGEAGGFYGKWLQEARVIIAAYGGAGGGASDSSGHYETKPYNFEVGSSENPRETYWDAMGRLADEVKWALFVDGDNVYYDPETSLIRQKPAAVINRLDPDVVSFTANWDVRDIATEATLELICSPFEFRAGDVFRLYGFGPASSGSTVDLPGRWLVTQMDRDRYGLVSRFTLKQPLRPGAEPANDREFVQDEEDSSAVNGTSAGPLRAKIVEIAKESMTTRTGFSRYDQNGALTAETTPPAPARTDCSQWVRACYLKAGAPDPGTYTGAMLTKAHRTSRPRPGDLVLSDSHVELYIGDGKTIGHGSPPIDYGDASYWISKGGFGYYTFDFLEEGSRKRPQRRLRPAAGSSYGTGGIGA